MKVSTNLKAALFDAFDFNVPATAASFRAKKKVKK